MIKESFRDEADKQALIAAREAEGLVLRRVDDATGELGFITAAEAEAQAVEDARVSLATTDAWLPRIMEEVLNLLVQKGAISLAELSADARARLAERERLRGVLTR